MSTIAVIGLGILVWVLVAILVALAVARMIGLRDRQHPEQAAPGAPAQDSLDVGAEPIRRPTRWRLRSKS